MRVSTAFNRMLELPGATVQSVAFSGDGIVIAIRSRTRAHRCRCGRRASGYDHSTRRWRHLDLAASKLWLEAEIWRVNCRHCGVHTELVPWARRNARHTRDFDDVVAWLCRRTDKTTVATLLRCSWEAVDNIIGRVVAEHLNEGRLDNLFHLGVDEIAYKRGHQYLTIVVDHDSGRVVWVAKDRTAAALDTFYQALGPQRRELVRAVSMDMGTAFRKATADAVPHAVICLDPFHAMQWVNQALDQVYSTTPRAGLALSGREWQKTRTALRSGAEHLDAHQRDRVNRLRRQRFALFRAWELKEQFRDLYRTVARSDASNYLQAWCTRALRSRLRPFRNLVKRIRNHFHGIVAAVEWGLSNSRVEGVNGKIRLINNRAHGHHTVLGLANSIYLTLGGITIPLPTQR